MHLHRQQAQRIPSRHRGFALLLVTIGLIVCTLLTAGFLATQGTSIGIARNERDAEKCRFLAQSGIDLCYSLIRNKSGWRESMLPGAWLTNYPVGDGTVTVTATSGNGLLFSIDPTQSVIFQSTATCNNRSFTLTSIIGPTGGGTVFRSGNFMQGITSIGSSLSSTAVFDSYNSSVAPYSSVKPGSNATVSTNALLGGLIITYPSVYRGGIVGGPLANILALITGTGALFSYPTSVAAALEPRTPGSVIAPNISGLTSKGTFSRTGTSTALSASGVYDQFSFSSSGAGSTLTVNGGTYAITGNFTTSSKTTINIPNAQDVVFYVQGNATFNGNIVIAGTGTMTMYTAANVTATSATINAGGSTASFKLLGLPSSSSLALNTNSNITGVIFMPQAGVVMQNGTSTVYGAIVASSLQLKDSSQFHFDEALKSLSLDNITGGSASPGTADYSVSVSPTN